MANSRDWLRKAGVAAVGVGAITVPTAAVLVASSTPAAAWTQAGSGCKANSGTTECESKSGSVYRGYVFDHQLTSSGASFFGHTKLWVDGTIANTGGHWFYPGHPPYVGPNMGGYKGTHGVCTTAYIGSTYIGSACATF